MLSWCSTKQMNKFVYFTLMETNLCDCSKFTSAVNQLLNCVEANNKKRCGRMKNRLVLLFVPKGSKKDFCGFVAFLKTDSVKRTFPEFRAVSLSVLSNYFVSQHPQLFHLCCCRVSALFSVTPLSCCDKPSEDEEGKCHTVHREDKDFFYDHTSI